MPMSPAAHLARLIAKSFAPLQFRGVGRLFGPLSRMPALRAVEGEVEVEPGRTLIFPAFDYYWAKFLWTGLTYEPDMELIFERLAPIPNKIFLDGGANIGYWTVKLSHPRYGFTRAVAVEANPAVYPYLRRNVDRNGLNCTPVHAALAAVSGKTVRIGAVGGHAVGAVQAEGVPIQTTTVESIVEPMLHGDPDAIAVVKLDIEGSEVDAMCGCGDLQTGNFIFVYEDWPKSGLPVSDCLLRQGLHVYGVNCAGAAERLLDVAEVHRFNRANTTTYQASNLIGVRRGLASLITGSDSEANR